ncbi:MAG: 16S rRNA (cytidine(1402)-2'-O)-methyltransferase [Myxococcales bacterium]|nr:16S rRNA (cytidine(1402)-2'-O)-methyltransferase [Myxococcales bacterium]
MGAGVLVLVGTPLGNRDDLSPRARAAILGADLLLCEDTRSPLRLLGRGKSDDSEEGEGASLPPRISCFVANEGDRVDLLLERLGRGERVVYVSEAGMPVWSDPGDKLVRAAVDAGFEVDVIPGPTAAAAALSLSGFSAADVRFLGFPPRGGKARTELLDALAGERAVAILYEAGNRTAELVRDLAGALPDADARSLVIARELTKLHQEVIRGTVVELAGRLDGTLRGEVTVVLAGAAATEDADAEDPGRAAARAVWATLGDSKLKPRAKAKRIAELTGLDAREVYAALSRDRSRD